MPAKSKRRRRSHKEAVAAAEELNSRLTIYDFPEQYVHIRTIEDYEAHIPSAIALRWERDWIFIFAEHHRPQVFESEEVVSVCEYRLLTNDSSLRDVKDFSPRKPDDEPA